MARPGNVEPKCYSLSRYHLSRLSQPIRETLSRTPYTLPEGATVSIKSFLESLLPQETPPEGRIAGEEDSKESFRKEIRDFCLCCAALASAEGEDSPTVYWITKDLIFAAKSAFHELSKAVSLESELELFVELMPEVLPGVKGVIKESSIDTEQEEIVPASAQVPVAHAIVAAHQFRWLVSQVNYPNLGKLCSLVIPCALTTLDHWSPEVKEQGMVSFIHVGNNMNAAELSWYEEAILDACCRNIPANDELWHRVVEVSVLLLTCTQRMNPRSSWFERMLSEMLAHLERQPFNKERRTAWLAFIEPVFDAMGLFILAHFRRIFALFFQWMHADDDKTVILVLERLHTIIQLTWIRKSPYIERLVDELVLLYKESAVRKSREVIRLHILQLLMLIQKCQELQFETAWSKHKNDPDIDALTSSFINQSRRALVLLKLVSQAFVHDSDDDLWVVAAW
ncbi:uncharacterized protein At2g39910 isoform X1 [Elaeis guineensis]|uniref:uncharacterized protein At2g39910 isoform X1 n=1 Tax=Elaeis guineensis var. tenera TaxID=51953 RepID=UPI003C6D2BFC